MRNYHIFLTNGQERNVKARDFDVTDGVLTFSNNAETVLIYAAGTWSYVEVERLDDKGYPEEDPASPK